MSRRRSPAAASAVLALAAAAGLAACSRSKPPAAPEASASRPDAARVDAARVIDAASPTPSAAPATPPPGPDACFDCHPDQADGYAATGMGHTLYRPDARPPIENFAADAATVTHPVSGLVYRAYVDDAGVWWQEETKPGTAHRRRVKVEYVVGSGNHTRSYFGIVEGELVQLPLTWYSHRRIWDMSPGYEGAGNLRFDRPVKPQCVFCHNDLSPARAGTLAGYEAPFAEGMTCTRCHGDGTQHVANRRAGRGPTDGAPDPWILDPGRLDPVGQLRLCQQCHLPGEARVLLEGQRWDRYDPRTPLEDFMSIYVFAEDGGREFGIAGHGKRLALSACFKGSGGRLSCTTCHDPHKLDEAKSRYTGCLTCHKVEDCGDAHGNREDKDCARCHMRSGGTSDIPHVTFTDHFIRARPDAPEGAERPTTTQLVDVLAPTRKGDTAARAAVREGMAHAHLWRFQGHDVHGPIAREKLTAALATRPDRGDAWFELAQLHEAAGDLAGADRAHAEAAKRDPDAVVPLLDWAEVLERMGRLDDAERVLRQAIAKRADYRQAWGNLGNVLQRLGRYADAEAAYARADALAPHEPITAGNRGYNAMQMGDLEAAAKHFQAAVDRDPTSASAVFNLGVLVARKGDQAGAQRFFERALELDAAFAPARWMRARGRLAAGDVVGARADLERMVRDAPRRVDGWIELARLHHRQGDRGAAFETVQRGLLAMPGHPMLMQAMQQLQAGAAP